jgi:hypothetical protein
VELMQASGLELVQQLGQALAPPPAAAGRPGARGAGPARSQATVSSRFNAQLEELMVGV